MTVNMLDFPVTKCYNAQANFVGTLVLCPFSGAFYTGIATRNAVSRWHGIGVFPAVREADYEGKENYCESKIISKTDLREVQGY